MFAIESKFLLIFCKTKSKTNLFLNILTMACDNCVAEHFAPLWCKKTFWHLSFLVRCKNAFLHQMLFCKKQVLTFSKFLLTKEQNVQKQSPFGRSFLCKNTFVCKNAFGVFLHSKKTKRTFYEVKCSASRKPLENVRKKHSIFCSQHFCTATMLESSK